MNGVFAALCNSELLCCRLPVLTEAVRLLSDPRLGNGDAERLQRAGWRLLPLLVLSSPADLPLSSCLTRCPLLRTHPLTLTWEQGNAEGIIYIYIYFV